MLAANSRGLDALKRNDYESAARHFREALGYVPDERTVKQNLKYAESQLEERLAAQKREAEARESIRLGVERLASVVGTTPSVATVSSSGSTLDFMSSTAVTPQYGAGSASLVNQDPNVVDLRNARTFTVDPTRVKGDPGVQQAIGLEFARTLDVPSMRDAVAPVSTDSIANKQRKIQASKQTLSNANYQKGFKLILAGQHALAVEYFKKAKAERGDDVLVNNALLLAEDLARVHRRKDKAAIDYNDGVVAMVNGNFEEAFRRLQAAVKLEPKNERYLDTLTFVRGIRLGVSLQRDRMQIGEREAAAAEAAVQLARKSSIPWSRGDRASAIAILEVAYEMSPSDPEIEALLKIARGAK